MDEMLQISLVDARKLIAAASGDAALLYLYLKSGAEPAKAAKELHMSSYQLELATASLRQLGLLPKQQHLLPTEERPVYTERDVANRIENGADFTKLVDEMQYTLGRVLSTEDMKILLGWTDYLGMTPDVIHILVNYCMNQNKLRGTLRTPTFRTMEKEAYYWADNGIETMEQAAAFAQKRRNQLPKLFIEKSPYKNRISTLYLKNLLFQRQNSNVNGLFKEFLILLPMLKGQPPAAPCF